MFLLDSRMIMLCNVLQDCSNALNTDRIVGGKDAPIGAYPWMARIGYLSMSKFLVLSNKL